MGLLYTKMKIFHFKEKLDSLPESVNKILPPIHIRIKPTNICNHKCRYCAYRANNLQLGKDMQLTDNIPKEKMFEIIDDLNEMDVQAVTFSGGGEPFCYPHLLESVKKLSQTNIKFAALTNGSRLKGELSELFAHHGTWLRISMDGWNDESYAFYRNTQDFEFTNILKNMEMFKKVGGKCYLGVSIIVDKYNHEHLYNLIKQLKNSGVDSVKISPCIMSNDCSKNKNYHRNIFYKVKVEVGKAIVDFSDDKFDIYDSYHILHEKFDKDYNWCPYQQILPVIGADLNIYSCQDKAYNKDEGLFASIREKHFKEVWYSNKSQFFSINPSLHCRHHCVANVKNKLLLEYLFADEKHINFV